MAIKIHYILFLIGLFAASTATAQDASLKSSGAEKIKGTRFIPYMDYSGSPYLNDKFFYGEIKFSDGTKVDNIGLRYSSYRDELLYYNKSISTNIIIDKISLKGFSFTDEKGIKRVFRRQNYDGYTFHGECFFEILSEGKISLLSYRKVNLEQCDESYNVYGLAYTKSYTYYMYSPEKGYSTLKISRNSLLSKFDKPNQKLVKKLLRKNSVLINDEASFVKAWNLVMENGIKIIF